MTNDELIERARGRAMSMRSVAAFEETNVRDKPTADLFRGDADVIDALADANADLIEELAARDALIEEALHKPYWTDMVEVLKRAPANNLAQHAARVWDDGHQEGQKSMLRSPIGDPIINPYVKSGAGK